MLFEASVILFFFNCYGHLEGSEWNYNELGPDVWGELVSACNGERQSPINIRTACTRQDNFPGLSFSPAHIQRMDFTLTNNGHTIQGKTSSSPSLTVNGGKLDGTFTFDSFHLHWGPNHKSGSEHQVNGEKFSGESHFVYRNPLTNQTAVLGFLMKSQATNKTREEKLKTNSLMSIQQMNEWKLYFDASQNLVHPGDSVSISLNLNILMGQNFQDFWRYNGSFTTPPCTESVVWTIFKELIPIFDYEFDTFRHDLFFESFRGPQPLYYRNVYRSFSRETVSPIPDQQCCIGKPSSASSMYLYPTILCALITQFLLA